MISKINTRQVGGDWYQSNYAHWDWVLNCGIGYLGGNATKYVARWRRAHKPADDLKKALHYVEKIIECCGDAPPTQRLERRKLRQETCLFADENNLAGSEFLICYLLATWQTSADLCIVQMLLKDLIGKVAREGVVPLEDSNKHAPRESAEDL